MSKDKDMPHHAIDLFPIHCTYCNQTMGRLLKGLNPKEFGINKNLILYAQEQADKLGNILNDGHIFAICPKCEKKNRMKAKVNMATNKVSID